MEAKDVTQPPTPPYVEAEEEVEVEVEMEEAEEEAKDYENDDPKPGEEVDQDQPTETAKVIVNIIGVVSIQLIYFVNGSGRPFMFRSCSPSSF
jgi:hypothetical protein